MPPKLVLREDLCRFAGERAACWSDLQSVENPPAPPVVALVGLLGILAGEQIIPLAKQIMNGHGVAAAWRRTGCGAHMFGPLPRQGSTPEGGIVNNVSEASS